MENVMRKLSMKNTEKLKVFFEIARELNQQFNSEPLLYGSLGLSQLLKENVDVDDIDLLIESDIFSNKLILIHNMMKRLGFKLHSLEENEFLRNEIRVGLATDSDMPTFAGIDAAQLDRITKPVRARILTLSQFLMCYTSSSKDSYRKEKYNKKDDIKIELIRKELNA